MTQLENMIQLLPIGYISYECIVQIKQEASHHYRLKREYYHDCKQLDLIRKKRNENYFCEEKERAKAILSNVKGYSLDEEQTRAVLTEEKYNLVVAGAGSGKSLTIIGKIRYLVECKKIPLQEILCISFTNEATKSLKETLLKFYGYDMEVLTFHKLALKVLRMNGGKVKIADDQFLDKIVENYIKKVFFEGKEERNWICQHLFHNEIQKIKKIVNKTENFPHIYNKLSQTSSFFLWKRVIITFIHLIKANHKTNSDIEHYLKKSKKLGVETKDTKYLKFLQQIYLEYQNQLERNNLYDFDDLIEKATILISKNCALFYQYIIIDEYQDTSYTRYLLIHELLKQTNASFMAVGDDFQSIYRFTGCDINIFLKFEHYFGKTEILKIQNTYRNSQQLIDIAGSFVMRNPNQLKKRLRSCKQLQKPIVICYYKNYLKTIEKLFEQIETTDLFLLGRNHRDLKALLKSSKFQTEDYHKVIYDNQESNPFLFYTVHTSKGLEASTVILLNMENKKIGFPSKVEDDSILKYITGKKDSYPYEEERRLFYVALTRTKNKIYILVPKQNPSCFIQELVSNYKNKIEIQNMI